MTLDSETRSHHPVRAPKKLIEVALPLDAINVAAAREKSIRHDLEDDEPMPTPTTGRRPRK